MTVLRPFFVFVWHFVSVLSLVAAEAPRVVAASFTGNSIVVAGAIAQTPGGEFLAAGYSGWPPTYVLNANIAFSDDCINWTNSGVDYAAADGVRDLAIVYHSGAWHGVHGNTLGTPFTVHVITAPDFYGPWTARGTLNLAGSAADEGGEPTAAAFSWATGPDGTPWVLFMRDQAEGLTHWLMHPNGATSGWGNLANWSSPVQIGTDEGANMYLMHDGTKWWRQSNDVNPGAEDYWFRTSTDTSPAGGWSALTVLELPSIITIGDSTGMLKAADGKVWCGISRGNPGVDPGPPGQSTWWSDNDGATWNGPFANTFTGFDEPVNWLPIRRNESPSRVPRRSVTVVSNP